MGFDILKAIGIGAVAAVGGVVVALLGIVAIFLFAIFGALVGAVTGWIVGMAPILGPLVKQGFTNIGILNPDLTAIGAALGFIAGFFKGGPAQSCGHKDW